MKRSQTIDVAKGIGILLVVFAHINLSQPSLTIIYSFHMPLFFFLSGMVFQPKKYQSIKEMYQIKFKSMICPYLIFCLLGILKTLFVYLIQFFILNKEVHFLDFLLHSFISVIWAPYSQKWFGLFNTPLWFVPCLLLVETMFFLLIQCLGKKKVCGGVLI